MLESIFLLIAACVGIWISTSFIIESVERIAPLLKVSTITLSLLVLGVITSLPEITVIINALLLNAPQIAVGNLIGSQIFLLFVVIPVLAIVSNGLSLKLELKNISLSLGVLLALIPMLSLFDQHIGITEASIIIVIYLIFALLFIRKSTMIEKIAQRLSQPSNGVATTEFFKALGCLIILCVASNTAVRQIIEIAAVLQTPRFLLSMILLPIATNLPEVSLAFSNFSKLRREVVIGDYLGAITFNAALLALLTFIVGGNIIIGQNISIVIVLFVIALAVFSVCSFSKRMLNSKEALLLLSLYVLLLVAAGWQIMSAFN